MSEQRFFSSSKPRPNQKQRPLTSKLHFAAPSRGTGKKEEERFKFCKKTKGKKISSRGRKGGLHYSLSKKESQGAPFLPFRSFSLALCALHSVQSLPLRTRNPVSLLFPFRKKVNRRTMPDIPAGKETMN